MPQTTLSLADGRQLRVSILGRDAYGRDKRGQTLTAPIYPFEALEWLIAEIQAYRDNDFDIVILITGDERSGKSTIAYHLARRLGLVDTSLINFQAEQLLDCMRFAPDGSVIWEDEAGASLYATEWWGYYQRQISKAFQVIGTKKFCFVLVLPHRTLLLRKIRNNRVRYWLHCYYSTSRKRKMPLKGKLTIRRGYAKIRECKRNEWTETPYWAPVFTLKFPKAEGEFWDEYEQYKRENIEKVLTVRPSRLEEIHKLADYRFIWELSTNGINGQKLTHREVAEIRQCSREYITQIVGKIRGDPNLLRMVKGDD